MHRKDDISCTFPVSKRSGDLMQEMHRIAEISCTFRKVGMSGTFPLHRINGGYLPYPLWCVWPGAYEPLKAVKEHET